MRGVTDAAGPVRNVAVRYIALARVADTQLVLGTEVLIELEIDLFAVGVQIVSGRNAGSLVALTMKRPAEARAIQPVACAEVVRLRHLIQNFADVSGRIHDRPEGIPR